jgi:anti-sigma regulatory factor (Ser/Thr protein kinase)
MVTARWDSRRAASGRNTLIIRTSASASHYTVLLSATRKGARLARLLATERIRGWELPHEKAALIVAELAANAVLHGRVHGRNFRLALSATADTLRIEVRDPRVERLPVVRPKTETGEQPRESGHGLLLVEELADRWGVEPELIGKTIWAELDLRA